MILTGHPPAMCRSNDVTTGGATFLRTASMDEAFVSLATNDEYAKGALALGQSLRETQTNKRLVLMITDGVTAPVGQQLACVWDELKLVNPLDSGEKEKLLLLQRPDLGITFTKLQAWRLTQYKKCVFLDADTLVLRNVDELFQREELSAAPDVGWPDCFNSGVFVFCPSLDTYASLIAFAETTGSFDGGDQGLLNLFWSDWPTKDIKHHLPFVFNVTPNVAYGYLPAVKQFGSEIRIIHFIGAVKPWHHQLTSTGLVFLKPGTYASQSAVLDYLQQWWDVYTRATATEHAVLSGDKGGVLHTAVQGTHPPQTQLSPGWGTHMFASTQHGKPTTPTSGPQVAQSGPQVAQPGPQLAMATPVIAPSAKSGSLSASPTLPPHAPSAGAQVQQGGGSQLLMTVTKKQEGITVVSVASADELRQAAWMRGQPDYTGQDRFENIQAKLDSVLQAPAPPKK